MGITCAIKKKGGGGLTEMRWLRLSQSRLEPACLVSTLAHGVALVVVGERGFAWMRG